MNLTAVSEHAFRSGPRIPKESTPSLTGAQRRLLASYGHEGLLSRWSVKPVHSCRPEDRRSTVDPSLDDHCYRDSGKTTSRPDAWMDKDGFSPTPGGTFHQF